MSKTTPAKSCENCANSSECKKSIGFMFGFCNTDFTPKQNTPKGKAATP